MKKTQKTSATEFEHLVDLLAASRLLKEKTRISLYLPKAVVKIMDTLSENQSRSNLVKELVINQAQKAKKKKPKQLQDPYGMFKDTGKKFDNIDQDIKDMWAESLNKVERQTEGKFD